PATLVSDDVSIISYIIEALLFLEIIVTDIQVDAYNLPLTGSQPVIRVDPSMADRPPTPQPPSDPHAVEQGEDAFRRVVIREERERSDLPPDDARRRRRHARPELLHESLQDAWVALPQEGDVRASAILHPE